MHFSASPVFGSNGTPETIEQPTRKSQSKSAPKTDLPWQVLVHNDPINLVEYVTMVFQKVFGYSRQRARQHMLEVHEKGRSIVWAGNREHAELYVQQLRGYHLLSTLERIVS